MVYTKKTTFSNHTRVTLTAALWIINVIGLTRTFHVLKTSHFKWKIRCYAHGPNLRYFSP